MRAINLAGGGLLVLVGVLMVAGVWLRLTDALQATLVGYVPAI